MPVLWCIKARPQNTILKDELLSVFAPLVTCTHNPHVSRSNLWWLGMYHCLSSVREMGEGYSLTITFRFFIFIFSVVNFLLLWIYCLFGAFALTLWLIVCIRYHRSISVSAWGCIDTRIIDPGIRVGDPEGSSVAESRSSCFWTAAWSVTSSLTPAGWSRVG